MQTVIPEPNRERAEMETLKASLRPLDLTRRFALNDVGRRDLTPALYEALVQTLYDTDEDRWREQILAAWTLGNAALTDAQTAQAAAALGSVAGDRLANVARRAYDRAERANLRTQRGLQPVGGMLAGLGFLFSGITLQSFVISIMSALLTYGVVYFGGTICLLPFTVPYFAAQDARNAARVRAEACRALRRLGWPQSAGALGQAATDGHPDVRIAAGDALRVVLPKLTPEHYGRLEAETTRHLAAALRMRQEPKEESLALLLLSALENVGDAHALPDVAEVAAHAPSPHIRSEAARILPLLEARKQQENDRRVLLRHSHAPPAPAHELLRPTNAAPDTPPEQLLRAAQSGD